MHLIVDLIFCPITSDFRANLDFFAKKSELIVDLIVHLIVDLIWTVADRDANTGTWRMGRSQCHPRMNSYCGKTGWT